MSEDKFLSLWTKYLPVIRILLKKSVNGDQQVALGEMELRSLDNRKNANYSFNLEILKGKMENRAGGTTIGRDLFTILNDDLQVRRFMVDKNVGFKMGSNFMLIIKSNPATIPEAPNPENVSVVEDSQADAAKS